ncbi:MAG: hypothetical protein Q9201_000654 [Fulgogasparrea decipioides]
MFTNPPVSGIHRLITAASTHSSQPSTPPLESVTEETHTYDLLYPDFHALQQSQDQVYPLRTGVPLPTASAASSFDDRGGLDIQNPRDIRIIIAQDGTLSQQAKILYDSHPPPPLPVGRTSPTEPRPGLIGRSQQLAGLSKKTQTLPEAPTGPKHTRSFSLNQALHTSPLQERSPLAAAPESKGAFSSPKSRRTSARPATSEGESHQTRLAREGKEEVDALLGCMFGSTGLPLVSGTKLHVRPLSATEDRNRLQSDITPTSPESGVPRPAPRRTTPLTRSTTADELRLLSASAPSERLDSPMPQSNSPSVLITRLFTVDISEFLGSHLAPDSTVVHHEGPEIEPQGFQFPRRASDVSEESGAKQIKCPTYALSLVFRLPLYTQQGWSSTPQLTSPVSPTSATGPSMLSVGGPWTEAKTQERSHLSIDQGIEPIVVHWSTLTKLLCSLEAMVRKRITLSLANLVRPVLLLARSPSTAPAQRNSEENIAPSKKKMKQPSQRTVQLPADALQDAEDVWQAAFTFGHRVAVLLRTRRVVTGQGRWGIWREEARWVGRWAGSREQNFFFFNLLTAFLGSHNEWLESLQSIPAHTLRKKSEKRGNTDHLRRQQTVIVSPNKMAARRLVFLLATFLPSTTPQGQDGMLFAKSARVGSSYSQSPPSGIPILREQSLRRTINRRQRGNRASQGSRALHTRSSSFDGPEPEFDGDGDHSFRGINGQHVRRASNANSIRSLAPPTSDSSESTRKSSRTTIATVVPEAAIPVAHFSNISRDPLMGTTATPRPGSSGSLASLSLKRTLSRSQSNEHSNASTGSPSFSRWGSMVSGFWSNRRGSSTDDSETMSPAAEGLGIFGVPRMPGHTSSSSTGALVKMVKEAENAPRLEHQSMGLGRRPQDLPSPETVLVMANEKTALEPETHPTQARSIPECPNAEGFPVKLSVDDADGIIDVELPSSNSYSSSFGSSVGSAGPCHTAASSFNDRSSVFTRSPSKERLQAVSSSPVDVAGWLKEYSPDFTLQAVKSYPGLKDDIKKAMRTEPAAQALAEEPSASDGSTEDWTDVATSIVADATKFSITRLCCQQRPAIKASPYTGFSSPSTAGARDQAVEERIIEEPVMDMDPTLIDAVERVLGQSGCSSRVQSRAASRAPSPTRSTHTFGSTRFKSQNDLRAMSAGRENHPSAIPTNSTLEVPKSECKKLVLGALEEVVRSVQAEEDAGGTGARRIGGEPVRKGEEDGLLRDSMLKEGVRRWFRGVGAVSGGS